MSRLIYILLIAAIWSVAIDAVAQTGEYLNSEFYSNYLPKTPSGSSVGAFGNIPVNYYAGLPEISFELVRLKGRRLEVPVSINYDASGVKTDEFSGECGLKWTIAAGGFVARKMNSRPDEDPVEGYWKYSRETNYYSNLDYPKWVNWCEKNERDGAPDDFTINIPGRSIRFVFNKDQGIVPVPRQNIRITHTVQDNRIKSFELVTEDGTRYFFGGSTETVASRYIATLNIRFKYDYKHAIGYGTSNGFPSDLYENGSESLSSQVNLEEKNTDIYNSRWYLASITTADGETTKFFYQNTGSVTYAARPAAVRLKPETTTLDQFTYTNRRCVNTGISGCTYQDVVYGPFVAVGALVKYPPTDPGSFCTDCTLSREYFNPTEYKATPGHLNSYHTLITESDIRLLRIEAATGSKVTFTHSPRIDLPGTAKIDRIALHDLNDVVVKSVKLNYKDVSANETNDFMWPGEAVILFNVGEVWQGDQNFYAHHIRKYFSHSIGESKLQKYVYEGLKEYNYKRSFLESVDQLSRNSAERIQLYKFEYKDADVLKRRTTPLHDAIGFQRTNGITYSWTFQAGKKAQVAQALNFDLISNLADLSGMLTTIRFPSGGSTTFSYESSGLNPRLQLISDFDEHNTIVSRKEIEYVVAAYNAVPVNFCVHDMNIWATPHWMKYIVNSTSPLNEVLLTHNTIRGNKVVKVFYGTKAANIGYEEFVFTSPVDAAWRDIPAPIYSHPVEQNANGQVLPYTTGIYPFPNARDRDYLRGMPLSHKVFAADAINPVKEIRYTYELNPYGYSPETILGLKGGSFNYATHTTNSFWFGHELEIEKRSRYSRYGYSPDWIILKKTRSIVYDPSASDTTRNFDVTAEYEYDPVHLQRTQVTSYNNDKPDEKQILRTRYITHQDYSSALPPVDCQLQLQNCLTSCNVITDSQQRNICYQNCNNQYVSSCADAAKLPSIAIQLMRSKHMITTPVEVQTLMSSGSQTKLISVILYKYLKQGAGSGFCKPYEVYDLKQPLDPGSYMVSRTTSDGSFISDTRLRLAHTYNIYDQTTGNVQKQTTRDGTVSTYEWGLNNSIVSGFVVNPDVAQRQQYSYGHFPMVGLISTTDPNGRVHRFEYDGFNRLRLTRGHDSNILSRYRYHYRGENESLRNDAITTSCTLESTAVTLRSAENVPIGQTSYRWDFGDGTPEHVTMDQDVQHTWPKKGNYVVSVRKENPEYYSKEAITLMRVYAKISAVNITINGPVSYDICSQKPPLQLTTLNAGVTGDALSYLWEYKVDQGTWLEMTSGTGPASRFSSPPPSAFGAPFIEGIFTIRFTAYDACGNASSSEAILTNYASTPGCNP